MNALNKEYNELAASYYQYRKRLGYSEKGCKAVYHYLLEFLRWSEQSGIADVPAFTAKDILDYERYLIQRPGKVTGSPLTGKSIYTHLVNIRNFFEMLHHEGKMSVNPCSSLALRYPKEQESRMSLSREEIDQIYRVAETFREKAILALGYGCGLRSGEMEACNVEDVKLREALLVVTHGKGNRRRVVPMSVGVKEALTEYCYKERFSRDRAFMINERGRRMRKWTFNYTLQEIIERTGNATLINKRVTMHHLRHSIATHLLESGVDIEQVRLFLGHHHLETTQIYTHINPEQLKDLIL